MKLQCACGALIYDIIDSQPNKAMVVPDQEWLEILDLLHDSICDPPPTIAERKQAYRTVFAAIMNVGRRAWQCDSCGRVYLDDRQYNAHGFAPDSTEIPREIFRSRPQLNDSV